MAEPMLRVTLVPTQIKASAADNVIPAVAEVVVDCRVPPGLGEEHVREQIAGVLGAQDPIARDRVPRHDDRQRVAL